MTLNYFSYADYIILPIAHIWSLKTKSAYFHKQKIVQPGYFSRKRWILDMFACVSFLIIWLQRIPNEQAPWSSAKESILSWKMKNSLKEPLPGKIQPIQSLALLHFMSPRGLILIWCYNSRFLPDCCAKCRWHVAILISCQLLSL